MNLRYWLTGTKDKPPIPRSTEARNLEINQSQSPKPILTSRAVALTWKAILLTLDQEHPSNSPEHWSKWSDTLEQQIVTADSHPSWLKLWPPYLTRRCLPPLIWTAGAQKQMERWPTSKKRISMRPSAKIRVIRMSTNQICTRYKISLWAKRTNNNKRRRRRTPISRLLRMTDTRYVTWWS